MENQKDSPEGEDIPSDFFDDFSKDEFIEGLSVIDSWNDDEKKSRPLRTRLKADLDKVKDLRDLIVRDEEKDDDSKYSLKRNKNPRDASQEQRRSGSTSHLDNYIRPGSRRDPNKTNEAIKKDKEEKVKKYLAKHLESNDDLRPPGTELDDYFDGKKVEEKKVSPPGKRPSASPPLHSAPFPKQRRESPLNRKDSPRHRRQQWSPRRPYVAAHRTWRSPRRSPPRFIRKSPRRPSPRRYSPRRFSPARDNRKYRFSPRRQSPDLRRRISRSPIKHVYRRSRSRSVHRDREVHRRSRSPKRKPEEDDFLYPKTYYPSNPTEVPYSTQTGPSYAQNMAEASHFSYAQDPSYSGYSVPYEYGAQPAPPMLMPAPQPVPPPIGIPTGPVPLGVPQVMAPAMVPAPQQTTPVPTMTPSLEPQSTPADALAKLVADGKLSHEDYLKLAPNKGAIHAMDTHARVAVLNRCNNALSKLGHIIAPTKLLINNNLFQVEQGPKQISPKFCSPLKRQVAMEFYFTKFDSTVAKHRNKQILDTIISTLCLEDAVWKPKKKVQKEMKDAAVQTVKPFCDVCEIRESSQFADQGTSIDHEHITSTVHTQVVEQDLISSKSVFNPSGSVADGAPISIAHMTPAQLVSQLAARAKTLKQTEPGQSANQIRKPNYDYDRGNNNYNYRY